MTQTFATEIRNIPLDQLHPHPDNPRLQLRTDVVERLTCEIRTAGFGPEHAMLVRPIDGGFQIISGHHRAEAAKDAECETAPCWVKELDDDEAFMQLVLSNTQGELSPLEIGMHALHAVPLAAGGRGRTGGLSEYADRLGFAKGSISKWRAAAEVAAQTVSGGNGLDLAEKVGHLYEISMANQTLWPLLVEQLIKRAWTVADTKSAVDKVRQFEIPDDHAEWLPLPEVVAAFLANDRFNPAAVARLIKGAGAVYELIDADGTEQDGDDFWNWLNDGRGDKSWKHQEISVYHAAYVRTLADRKAEAIRAAAAEEEARIVLPDGVDLRYGDFREVLADLEGKVDIIITDPPYPAEFLPLFDDLAKFAAAALKPGGICAVMIGQSYLPQIVNSLGTHLNYHWTLAYLTPGGQAVQLWQRKVNTFWKPVLIYTNGEYVGEWLGDVTKSDVNDNDKNHHHWGQSESGMADLIARLSKPGQLVCDPFLGGGTTAVVCHELGRRFVGCDIDETAVATSTDRFAPQEHEA